MTHAQVRSGIEALMTRLVQTESALMETRQQVAAGPKVAAPLVDTRTIGEALTFTGDHNNWPEWSFQSTSYMGSANPKSIGEVLGAQCSTVPGLGTAVQRKRIGNSEEHRSPQ